LRPRFARVCTRRNVREQAGAAARLPVSSLQQRGSSYEIVGEPTTINDARQLAQDDRHPFEHGALGLAGARKSGGVEAGDVRDLVGTVGREGAAMGWLITLEPITKPMQREAADAGFDVSPWGAHPKIQSIPIGDDPASSPIAPATAGRRTHGTGPSVPFRAA